MSRVSSKLKVSTLVFDQELTWTDLNWPGPWAWQFVGWFGGSLIAAQLSLALASPPQLKLNHKVELLCFADKTIIQTDSLHFIKISLTIFLHEFWFCSDLFYLSEKPLIYSCMLVHRTPAAAARPTNTWSLTAADPHPFELKIFLFRTVDVIYFLKREIYNSSELPQTF